MISPNRKVSTPAAIIIQKSRQATTFGVSLRFEGEIFTAKNAKKRKGFDRIVTASQGLRVGENKSYYNHRANVFLSQQFADQFVEPVEINRLGDVSAAAGGERVRPVLCFEMGGHRDHGDV